MGPPCLIEIWELRMFISIIQQNKSGKMKICNALQLITPSLEARILLSHASGLSQEYLIGHGEDELSDEIYNIFLNFVERRKRLEPIAYIIGRKEFYGRDYKVTKDVLIPRPDSETLIDVVLQDANDEASILELGVGSGCLVLTLLSELKKTRALGVDISQAALDVAALNAVVLGVQDRCKFVLSNWFENVSGRYDIIISNPPYIEENERSMMAPETLIYEPRLALFGGLEPYRIIAFEAHKFLSENGKIYVEIGINQAQQVEDIFFHQGYKVAGKYQDIEDRMRVISFALAMGK